MYRLFGGYVDAIKERYIVCVFVFLLLLYIFCKPIFVLNRFWLRYFHGDSEGLVYDTVVYNGIISKVYVKGVNSNLFWNELDYVLCGFDIDKGITLNEFDNFKKVNITCGDLLRTMDKNYEIYDINVDYRYVKSQYLVRIYVSFICYIMFIVFYLFVLK